MWVAFLLLFLVLTVGVLVYLVKKRKKGALRAIIVVGLLASLALLAMLTMYSDKASLPDMAPPDTSATIPAFPWPPPPASAETRIPRHWLTTTEGAQLAEIAGRLEHALQEAGYRRWSFSSVPNGFALVSQMEQTKADGTPSPEPARWSTDLPWVGNLSLLEFIKALVNAQPGYYRVIVFIVTDQPWSRTGEQPTGEEAERWLAEGFNWLPRSIGDLPYGPEYKTTALVYEFKKVSQYAEANFPDVSSISAEDHLEKAGIARPLGQR